MAADIAGAVANSNNAAPLNAAPRAANVGLAGAAGTAGVGGGGGGMGALSGLDASAHSLAQQQLRMQRLQSHTRLAALQEIRESGGSIGSSVAAVGLSTEA